MTDNPKCVFARFCHPGATRGRSPNGPPIPEHATGHPQASMPRRTADGLGPKNGQPYEFRFRPGSRADRGRHHRQQRRPVDSRRHSPAAREDGHTKSATAWSHAAAASRPTNPTATARSGDQVARQPRRRTGRRNAARGGLLTPRQTKASLRRLAFCHSITPLRAAAPIQQSAISR